METLKHEEQPQEGMRIESQQAKTNNHEKTEIDIFKNLHQLLSYALINGNCKEAKKWMKEKCLGIEKSHATFHSGELHVGKKSCYKEALASIDFLTPNKRMLQGLPTYSAFGKQSMLFPLRNENNETVNFYAIGLKNTKQEFLNHKGIYPNYPHEQTQKLFITDTVMDAATLIESKILDNRESVMALYDGVFLEQHIQAIQSLKHLTEVIQIRQCGNEAIR